MWPNDCVVQSSCCSKISTVCLLQNSEKKALNYFKKFLCNLKYYRTSDNTFMKKKENKDK